MPSKRPRRRESTTKRAAVKARGLVVPRNRRLLLAGAAITTTVVAAIALVVLQAPVRPAPGALRPFDGPDPGVAHVHGLGVDPADGTLYAATHFGLFKIPERGRASRIANRYQDTMGFTVAGPQHFLGSGHPDLRENLPGRLGLIESIDGGQTWRRLSLTGQADFHALEFKHGQVYGFDAASGQLLVSADRTTWDGRARLLMADFTVSPSSPDRLLAATERGLTRSTDGGRTFTMVNGAPPLAVLDWSAEQVVYGVAADGTVHTSADGGSTWQPRGKLDAEPHAITATDASRLYVATETGIYASTNGGTTFTLRYRGSG